MNSWMSLYIRLFIKRISDSRLIVKMNVFLFFTTIFTCIVIGGISYKLAKDSLLENAEVMSVNLMKQAGLNMDDRIRMMRDTSYRILQTNSMESVLGQSYWEAERNKQNQKEVLSNEIVQQTNMFRFTRYALLQTNSGYIYEYYKSDEKKLNSDEKESVLDNLREKVRIGRNTAWVMCEGTFYFVRLILNEEQQIQGLLCIAVTDEFLEFIGTDQKYLQNDGIVIYDSKVNLIKNKTDMREENLDELVHYKNRDFYVYTTQENMNKKIYSVVVLNTIEFDWTIIGFMPWSILLEKVSDITSIIILVMTVILILVFLVTYLISRTVTGNVKVIEQGMKNYEEGHFELKIKPVNYDEIGKLALQLNYMGMKISELLLLLEEKEKEKAEYEIQTLQAQINPHFLYNTLGSIEFASRRKKENETADTVKALVQLLRFTIKNANRQLPLKEEIDYIKNYVKIENMRYGNAFMVEYQIAKEVEDILIPGFVYQPLVENSILHGFDMSKEGNRIIVSAKREQNFLILGVVDNGIGMSEVKRKQILASKSDEIKKKKGLNSIGINIIDKRLKNYYGESYYFQVNSKEGEGTEIFLFLPLSHNSRNN